MMRLAIKVIGRQSLVLLLFLALITTAPALTVRVDPASSAPRLVVNGARSAPDLLGAPGSAPIPISPQAQEVAFEFVASGSATNGTMHFRFGQTPGDIWLDDIHVVDLDNSQEVVSENDFESGPGSFAHNWTVWPVGEKNTVGTVQVAPGSGRNGSAGLHVQLKAPAGGHWPDFHIYHQPRLAIQQGHRYRASFWVRAVPARDILVAFYRPGTTYTHLGGPQDRFASQIQLAANVGVNLVSFPISTPWPKPGAAADWSEVDLACQAVLRANPKALLLPRMGMDPPAWWREAHLDDVMKWEDGHRDAAVVASPLYRHDASERLAALVAHLEEKFGEQMAGYHPCGQNTGEWFYRDTWLRPLNGYAPADLTAWRLWLHAHYPSDAALQASWHDPAATRATAAVPSPAAPRGAGRHLP